MKFCDICNSPLCGACNYCIIEYHPKHNDGSVSEFGTKCPWVKFDKDWNVVDVLSLERIKMDLRND